MYKLCMRYVGACNVLPLNSMVEAAPQLHGYANSCQYTVSNLPLRGSEGHLNLWLWVVKQSLKRSCGT